MSSWPDVLSQGAIRGEAAGRMPGGVKPLPPSRPLACRLVGILRAVVARAVLAMCHTWADVLRGRAVAFQLIRDDHARYVRQPLEEFAEARLRRVLVSPPLPQDVEHVPVLIHRPPQGMACAVDGQKHRIQLPLSARTGTPLPELLGLRLAELPAPLPARFIGHEDPAGEQQLFHITVAQAAAEVEPDAMAHAVGRKTRVLVWRGWDGGMHGSSQDGLLRSGELLPRPRRGVHGTSMPRRAEAVQRGAVKLTMPLEGN
jgi:hypothetical protein